MLILLIELPGLANTPLRNDTRGILKIKLQRLIIVQVRSLRNSTKSHNEAALEHGISLLAAYRGSTNFATRQNRFGPKPISVNPKIKFLFFFSEGLRQVSSAGEAGIEWE